MIAKLVHDLRQKGYFRSNCKDYRGKDLVDMLGIKPYRGLKRDFDAEVDRQFARDKNKGFVDPLMERKESRLDRVKEIYLDHASFAGNYYDRDKGDQRFVSDYDGKRRMALVRVDGWVQYSRRYGTWRRMAGLVLFDVDSKEYRFLRVGPDVETVEGALDYIKPAAVIKAERKGLQVKRQGDMYFVPQKRWNLSALKYSNHEAEAVNSHYVIHHETHPDLLLETPHKAYQQMLVRNAGFGPGGRMTGHGD